MVRHFFNKEVYLIRMPTQHSEHSNTNNVTSGVFPLGFEGGSSSESQDMSGSESNVLSSKSGALSSCKLTTYEAKTVTESVNRLI